MLFCGFYPATTDAAGQSSADTQTAEESLIYTTMDAEIQTQSEGSGTETSSAPAASKTISDNGDGTYNITLSVTGSQSTTTTTSKFNVVLVADLSGSMSREYDGTAPQTFNGYFWTPNDEYDSSKSRIAAEKAALKAFGEELDTLNASDRENPTVVANLVTFGSTATLYNNNYYDFRDEQPYQTKVASLTPYSENPNENSYEGATNWEDAFEKADAATFKNPDGTSRDDLPTYVIFLSDGDPTVRNSRNGRYSDFEIPVYNNPYTFKIFENDGDYDSDPYIYDDYLYLKRLGIAPNLSDTRFTNSDGTGVYGSGVGETSAFLNNTEYKSKLNYNAGLEAAKDVKNNGKEIYAVGVYNNVTQMQNLVTGLGESTIDYYYDVEASTEQDGLVNTLKSIAKTITTKNNYRNVKIHDHITDLTSADIKIDGAEAGEFTYQITKDGTTTEWDAAKNATTPPASITNGEVIFDPSSILTDGILEGGVTYSVSYRVWPSQDALDTVAKLNNGLIQSYDNLDQEIKDQILPPDDDKNYYRLKTNVDNVDSDVTQGTYVEYEHINKVTVEPGGGTTYETDSGKSSVDNPEPIPLQWAEITIQKEWKNVDPEDEDISSITLNLLEDGKNYITGIELTNNNGVWETKKNVAVGLIGRDPADLKDTTITEKRRQILEIGHKYTLDEINITYTDGTSKTVSDAGFNLTNTDSTHPMLDDWEKTINSDGTYNLLNYTVVNLLKTGSINVYDELTSDDVSVEDGSFVLKATNTKNQSNVDVTLVKVDSITETLLANATFELYKADESGESVTGNVLQTVTTTSDGKIKLTGLEAGTYLLKETVTPDGYVTPANPWKIVVDDDSTVTVYQKSGDEWVEVTDKDSAGNCEIKNEPTTDVPLKKIDSETSESLSDAEFSLYKASVGTDGEWIQDGEAIKTQITSGPDGTFEIENLEEGKYLLVETSTPAGYQEPIHDWRIEVTKGSNGLVTTVQAYQDSQWKTVETDSDDNIPIKNVPVDYELPSSGGIGTTPFKAAGLIIMLIAVLAYINYSKMSRERGTGK